jgi:hypothetical protein
LWVNALASADSPGQCNHLGYINSNGAITTGTQNASFPYNIPYFPKIQFVHIAFFLYNTPTEFKNLYDGMYLGSLSRLINKKQLSAQREQWAHAFKDNFIFAFFSSSMARISVLSTPAVFFFLNI